jgi:transcriptional regulator with XRE-family HTH domain
MGQRLQELRRAKGMSQPQLAEAAKVSVGALRNWEQGRRLPYIDTAYRIARALGITVDDLIGEAFEQASGESKPAAKEKRGRKKGKGE